MTLSQATGDVVRAHEFSDDRLEIVLRLLSDDEAWVSFESALNQHLVRVYDLQAERVHVDSTSVSAYVSVSDDGLFQFGHSNSRFALTFLYDLCRKALSKCFSAPAGAFNTP